MRAASAVHPMPCKTGRKGRECRLGSMVGIGDGGDEVTTLCEPYRKLERPTGRAHGIFAG